MRLKWALSTLLFFTCLTATCTAFAALGCYDMRSYPVAYNIYKTGHSLNVIIEKPRRFNSNYSLADIKVASRGENNHWRIMRKMLNCAKKECEILHKTDDKCTYLIPKLPLDYTELKKIDPDAAKAIDYREQKEYGNAIDQEIGSCIKINNIIWFGVTFYCGEGTCGIGGIGRYDIEADKVEVYRTHLTNNASVSPILLDGDYIWAGTYSNGECMGEDPVSGLIRYDWKNNKAVGFAGGTDTKHDPQGPCGFKFNAIYLDKEGLWATSDMGLTHLTNPQAAPPKMHWVNYIPNPDSQKNQMAMIDCKALYIHLIRTLSNNDLDGTYPYPGHYGQFLYYLTQFNKPLLDQISEKMHVIRHIH